MLEPLAREIYMHKDFYEKLGEITSKKRGSETMELFEKIVKFWLPTELL